jgi:RNA polymerase sigma factor (sigma-70 family)
MRTLSIEKQSDTIATRDDANVQHASPLPVGHELTDVDLTDHVRAGQTAFFGVLFERHLAAAYNLARQLTRCQADADELVSTTFAKVLDALRAGNGPHSAFRAYLLTAVRHTAYDSTRRSRKCESFDDVTTAHGMKPEHVIVPFVDTAVAGLERSLAANAFARLPERWQAVLWHTEIEGMRPAEVALLLGLTPNGVSALAYRAREGLKQAYLQMHLSAEVATKCQHISDRMGAGVRGGLSRRELARVTAHLDGCDDCRNRFSYLVELNSQLR